MFYLIKDIDDKMIKFNILNKILLNSYKLFFVFFIFRFLLIFIYVLGGYQDFTIDSSKLILRFLMSNEVLITLFSMLCVINIIKLNKRNFFIKLLIIVFFILNIIYSFFAVIFSILVIAFA